MSSELNAVMAKMLGPTHVYTDEEMAALMGNINPPMPPNPSSLRIDIPTEDVYGELPPLPSSPQLTLMSLYSQLPVRPTPLKNLRRGTIQYSIQLIFDALVMRGILPTERLLITAGRKLLYLQQHVRELLQQGSITNTSPIVEQLRKVYVYNEGLKMYVAAVAQNLVAPPTGGKRKTYNKSVRTKHRRKPRTRRKH